MKKFGKYFVAATIVVATTAAVLVGCKKEKDEPKDNAQQSEAAVLVNRINNFLELRDAVNSGAKADGSMTVEEMRQILDLTTNYEHSNHMTYCLNTVLDTLHVTMPQVDGNGDVSETDVAKVYDAFETELEKKMFAVNDAMNIPSYFSIVMPKIEAKDADIQVVFLRGEADVYSGYDEHTSDGPFGEGDDYKWGLLYGHCPCDPSARLTDAAVELSRQFKFVPDAEHQGCSYILENVEHVVYTALSCASSGVQELETAVVYTDDNMENCADFWLYWMSGEFTEEPCIYFDEMNCYWRSLRRNIVLPNARLHYGPTTNSPYHECALHSYHLWGSNPLKRSVRMHAAAVVYCNISWSEPTLPPVR